MNAENSETVNGEAVAALLVRDLVTIGSVTYSTRLTGYGLFEDGVMFGFVEADGTFYLRATARTAEYFNSRGATKHREMPYWSVPDAVASDIQVLRDLAYQAADNAHLAASFGIDDLSPAVTKLSTLGTVSTVVKTMTLLAA